MIFLTGATGLVGSFICRKMLAEGRSIKALRRKDSKFSLLKEVAEKIEWVEGDLLDILSLNQAMQGCQAVIHCAGMVSYHKKDADRLDQINREGTANMVNAAISQQIECFIHISSVAAIGRSARLECIDESFNWNDSDEHSAYGMSKYAAELEAFRGSVEGLKTVVLNPSVVLGPGRWDESSTRLFKYVKEERPFYTDGAMNYIDARDLANITFAALKGELSWGERYIVSAGAIPYKHFFDLVAENLHKKAPSIHVNLSWLKGAYYLELLRATFSGKAPLVTRETLKLASQHIEFSNKKLTQATEYQMTPLQETVQWTCRKLLE